jgi:tRNA(Arg) A34 adenosine deaminase TadA
MKPTAFLIHEQTIHFTSDTDHPVTALLESIWDQDPDQARAITRNRIIHSAPLTPSCQGMIKVVGKRASQVSESTLATLFDQLITDHLTVKHKRVSRLVSTPIQLPAAAISITDAMIIAREFSALSIKGIGAVLLGPDNRILSYGWNDHFKNRVNHAEIMLIRNHQQLHRKLIPRGSTLVVTLQPCAMCAGYLHAHCEDFNHLNIVYAETDPGRFAQNSILIEGSDLHRKSGLFGTPKVIKL